MDDGGGEAQDGAGDPHGIVIAEHLIEFPGHDQTREAAHLMAEKDDTKQHADIVGPMQFGDRHAGQGHGGKPQQTNNGAEYQQNRFRHGNDQQPHRGQTAQRIDDRQRIFRAKCAADLACRDRANDVEPIKASPAVPAAADRPQTRAKFGK